MGYEVFKTTNPSYFPLVSAKPAWKLDFSGNVIDTLMDRLNVDLNPTTGRGLLALLVGDLPGTAYTVTAASWSGGVVTLTVSASHGIPVRQYLQISGITPSGYNQTDMIATTGTAGTTVKFALSTNPGTYTGGGTIVVGTTAADGMLAVDPTGVLNFRQSGSFAPLGAGTVTHSAGALTSGALVAGNGSGDLKTPSSAASLDSSGKLTLNALILTQATLTLVNGLNSDLNIGSLSYEAISGPTGAFSVGGFTGGADGRVLFVWNSTTQAMTLVNEDASSAAANRIQTLTGGNVTLATRMSFAIFIYASNNRWTLAATN